MKRRSANIQPSSLSPPEMGSCNLMSDLPIFFASKAGAIKISLTEITYMSQHEKAMSMSYIFALKWVHKFCPALIRSQHLNERCFASLTIKAATCTSLITAHSYCWNIFFHLASNSFKGENCRASINTNNFAFHPSHGFSHTGAAREEIPHFWVENKPDRVKSTTFHWDTSQTLYDSSSQPWWLFFCWTKVHPILFIPFALKVKSFKLTGVQVLEPSSLFKYQADRLSIYGLSSHSISPETC